MLVELKVSGFAVIDQMEIHFLRPGLNILTGETGAGKSILVKSLALLLGGKASPESVRTGHEQAVVEGAFDLSGRPDVRQTLADIAYSHDQEDLLVVRRIIGRQGKHRVYINGHLATLNVLEPLMSTLVEITGQHEHQSLLKTASQLALLDRYAELEKELMQYKVLFEKSCGIRSQIEELLDQNKDKSQRLEFLEFQIQEIENFNPTAADDGELVDRYQKARHAAKISSFIQKAESVLYSADESVTHQISEIAREAESLTVIDKAFGDMAQDLKAIRIQVDDVAFKVRDYSLSDDQTDTEKVEERLSQWRRIQKKYGQTSAQVLEFLEQARQERDRLTHFEETIEKLKIEHQLALNECQKKAELLHKRRTKAAEELSEAVSKELRDLNMKGVGFSIQTKAETLSSSGITQVSFLIQNGNDAPKPMNKVASGGELSRVMLAIKQKIAHQEHPMTYFFDEVDAGISGPTAEKVGRKLKRLGKSQQVVSITHLPQVAAFADAHFLISKEVSKGQVFSRVAELNENERVQEVGRLISGEKITPTSLAHAKELLQLHH